MDVDETSCFLSSDCAPCEMKFPLLGCCSSGRINPSIVCVYSLVCFLMILTHSASLFTLSDIVEALLRNEALTNIADNKGCYPLHLAAWKGDEHIVKLLIHQGPSHPKLNEQVCFMPLVLKWICLIWPLLHLNMTDVTVNQTCPLPCSV